MWTRRSLLAGSAALLAFPRLAGASSGKKLVVVLASGGWDVTYALDPKLGAPRVDGPELDEDPDDPDDRESSQTFGGIPVVVNAVKRPAVSAFFDAYARFTTLVNGVFVSAISHESSLTRVLTGTGDERAPDFAAVHGVTDAVAPLAYVDLSGQAYFGPWADRCGRLGENGQLGLLLDADGFQAPAGAAYTLPTWSPDAADRAALDAHVRWRAGIAPTAEGAQLLAARERAARLRESLPAALSGMVPGEGASFARDGEAAVELLRNGICRSVLLDSRAHWDTHADNGQQHQSWQALFVGLNQLVGGLIARGMLEDTLVVVVSEMTRTPLRNAYAGKDHWPYTSALVVGGGIGGGRVLGATDDGLVSVGVDLETGAPSPEGVVPRYDNLVAGLLEQLDVDPGERLPGVTPLRGL